MGSQTSDGDSSWQQRNNPEAQGPEFCRLAFRVLFPGPPVLELSSTCRGLGIDFGSLLFSFSSISLLLISPKAKAQCGI